MSLLLLKFLLASASLAVLGIALFRMAPETRGWRHARRAIIGMAACAVVALEGALASILIGMPL